MITDTLLRNVHLDADDVPVVQAALAKLLARELTLPPGELRFRWIGDAPYYEGLDLEFTHPWTFPVGHLKLAARCAEGFIAGWNAAQLTRCP